MDVILMKRGIGVINLQNLPVSPNLFDYPLIFSIFEESQTFSPGYIIISFGLFVQHIPYSVAWIH